MKKSGKKLAAIGMGLLASSVLPLSAAFAAMPWEGGLQTVQQSLEGPTARAISMMIIIGTGLALSVSEFGGAMKKILMIVLGLGLTFGAASFIGAIGG